MKRFFTGLVSIVLVLGGLAYVFKSQLMDVIGAGITKDMYVETDADSFDPGLAVGELMPGIRAKYKGEEITSLNRFIGDKGMIFIANRSASW